MIFRGLFNLSLSAIDIEDLMLSRCDLHLFDLKAQQQKEGICHWKAGSPCFAAQNPSMVSDTGKKLRQWVRKVSESYTFSKKNHRHSWRHSVALAGTARPGADTCRICEMPLTSNEFLSWVTGCSSSETTYTPSSDFSDTENNPLWIKKKNHNPTSQCNSAEDGHSLAQGEYKVNCAF